MPENMAVVLIVEDEKPIRQILSKVLSKEFAVLEAANGKESLSLLRSCKDISVVILDYMLPDTNGLEILRECRAKIETYVQPMVIIYSGVTGLIDKDESDKLDVFMIVPKTESVFKLMEKVRQAVELSKNRNGVARLLKLVASELEINENNKKGDVACNA